MKDYFEVSCSEFNKVYLSGVSKYAKMVWIYHQYLNYHGLPLQSVEAIATKLNISIPHVKAALKSLEVKGFLKEGGQNG